MVINQNTERIIEQKSFLWNIIGSAVSAASSFVLLLCVTRTVGASEGGIFSLAFATSQILLTIGKFGVRAFQATDIKGEISFGTYLQTRIWFCLSMLFVAIFYTLLVGYDLKKGLIFILVCIIKMADAIEDVFHGQLQNIGHLDIAGKLLTVRNLFTMLVFGLCMYSLKDLLLACILTAIISGIATAALNIIVTNRYFTITITSERDQAFGLIKACSPLFLGSFLSLYIYNAPKYMIDFIGSEIEITYYSIIFMPTFVINLFSEFVFKPLLTVIASKWMDGNFLMFFQIIKKLLINIIGITLTSVLIAYLFGPQLLSKFYSVDVTYYRLEIVLLMLSGGFSAAVYLFYNILTSMRLQKTIIINYFSASIVITLVSYIFVKSLHIMGAVVAYLFTEILLFSLMLIGTYFGYRKGLRKSESRYHNFSGNK